MVRASDLVVKPYNEEKTLASYHRRFKERRSSDNRINKIKDYLWDNLKTKWTGTEGFLNDLGNSRFGYIASHFNIEIDKEIYRINIPMSELRNCVDTLDFIDLSVETQNAWITISSRDRIDADARLEYALKRIFGDGSRTYQKMEKLMKRKMTIFESLFNDPVSEGAYGYVVSSDDIRKAIT